MPNVKELYYMIYKTKEMKKKKMNNNVNDGSDFRPSRLPRHIFFKIIQLLCSDL